MAYSIEVADALVKTLGKFKTLNNYQLAGQLANIEFWADEVRHVVRVLDGYSRRDSDRKKSERHYINTHDTKRFDAYEKEVFNDVLDPEFLRPALPDDYLIESSVIKAKRQQVADALYHFLKRCHKEQLLTGEEAKACLKSCDLGWEPGDFSLHGRDPNV
ncbi:hypothetical protein [Aeoliella sp. SH292]|uniref:hypothetical protein n=1 Tax=Aeoliella sp. SH292 TaxID=3454464 RepID=UPI003F96239A